MRKMHVILIIVSVLIIFLIIGFFTIKFLNNENEDWLYESGDSVEMIFDDVSESHWASEYILYLTKREIMGPSGDGKFYPENNVTYGEFFESILRCSTRGIDFDEIQSDDLIKLLERNRVIEKDEIKMDKLTNYIIKSDVGIFLAKVDMKIRNKKQIVNALKYNDLTNFDEVSQTLLAHSVSSGYFGIEKDSNFYPNQTITRAEMSKILYLFLNK